MKQDVNEHREVDYEHDSPASSGPDGRFSDVDLEKKVDNHRIDGPEEGDTVVTAKTWAVVMV